MENYSRTFLFEPNYFVPLEEAWGWQRQWQQHLFANPEAPQAIWLLEHTKCFTQGRGGNDENFLFDLKHSPFDWYRVDRGGDVTHHLPGQLVAYPILDLSRYKTDLHWYLNQLEQVLINVMSSLGLQGERRSGFTGVWYEGKKVGSIGVGCRRWITQHGLALNIDCDLKGFDLVVPCGLSEYKVGRLDEWLPGLLSEEVRPLLIEAFADCFDLNFCIADVCEMPSIFPSSF